MEGKMHTKSKNILITGGAGFIGSCIALKLLKNTNYNITVLDILDTQIHGTPPEASKLYLLIHDNLCDRLKFIKGSVTDYDLLTRLLENTDVVIHLAALTGTGQSMYDIKKYCTTNILGTATLLDIITNKKTNVKKIIVAQSRAVYGEGKYICKDCGTVYPIARLDSDMKKGDFNVKCPICGCNVELTSTTEDCLLHPTSVYGITKQMQGELVHCVCRSLGIQSVSFRYQNVYGPGQSLKNPYTGILSIFSNSLRQNNDINIFEDGKETRDFVYVDDVADATISAIENEKCSGLCFNIGTGQAIDVLTVANTLKQIYHSNSKITVTGNYRLGDIRHNKADITLAKKILNWQPKYTFEQGLKLFCDWVKTQPIEKDGYQKSLQEMKEKGLFCGK